MANLVSKANPPANPAAGTATVYVPLVSQQVRVEKRKYPASLRRTYVAHPLGTDHWGEWLGVPAEDALLLLPNDGWWVAWFRLDGSLRIDVAAAVTTGGPAATAALRSFVDLDLDIERDAAGGTVILDEDQFAERCGAYPAAWVAVARATVVEAADLARNRVEPFARAHATWVQLWQSTPPVESQPPEELQQLSAVAP